MSSLFLIHAGTALPFKPPPLLSPPIPRRVLVVVRSSAVSLPEKRTRTRRRKQHSKDDYASSSVASAAEKSLRFTFMEELMERARNRDCLGVSHVIYDMIAAGLNPGPHSFHGLIVSHALNADQQGAVCHRFKLHFFFGYLFLYYNGNNEYYNTDDN